MSQTPTVAAKWSKVALQWLPFADAAYAGVICTGVFTTGHVGAEALAELEENGAEEAVQAVTRGLDAIRQIFTEHDVEEQFESDELVVRLVELRESLRREYDVGRTLQEQLDEAVQKEQYEKAAELRDELNRRHAS